MNDLDIKRILDSYFDNFSQQICVIKDFALSTKDLPEYITPVQFSALTGFTLRASEAMRARRIGPAYIKVGKAKNGPIRYRLEDVRAWMQSHMEVTNAGR